MKKVIEKVKGNNDTKAVVQKTQGQIKSALNMFTKAKEQIVKANKELTEAITKDTLKIEELAKNVAEGNEEIKANQRILKKLEEFVPNK